MCVGMFSHDEFSFHGDKNRLPGSPWIQAYDRMHYIFTPDCSSVVVCNNPHRLHLMTVSGAAKYISL